MAGMLRAAVVQTCTPATPGAGLAHAAPLVRSAAAAGARLIVTPEGSNLLQRDRAVFAHAAPAVDDPAALAGWAALAGELRVTLVAGSLLLRTPGGKAVNRCHVFGPDGSVLAHYDKIHLFDVNLGPGAGGETRESEAYEAGAAARVAATPEGPVGLTICYDLRFPALFRQLAQAGAGLITLPAAFTRPTGAAHWDILVRARAIETGAFVLAAAQGGRHEDGRETWGHSMIIGPWGDVRAHLDHDEPGFAVADLDLADVAAARAKVPAWSLDRPWAPPAP